MTIQLESVISLLTVLGIGSVVGAYFQLLFQHRREVKEHEHALHQLFMGHRRNWYVFN